MINQLWAFIIICISICLDLLTLYLHLRRNRIGKGASGIPVIPLLGYILGTLLLRIPLWSKAVLAAMLFMIYYICHYAIPRIDIMWFNGKTALHRAILRGDLAAITELIHEAKYIETRDNVGITPLHLAAELGLVEVVCLLLSTGTSANEVDIKGRTPLHFAAHEGHDQVIVDLLDAGANPKAMSGLWGLPLQVSIVSGHFPAFLRLLDACGNECLAGENRQKLIESALWGGSVDMMGEAVDP